jgi:hypothetical protein
LKSSQWLDDYSSIKEKEDPELEKVQKKLKQFDTAERKTE